MSDPTRSDSPDSKLKIHNSQFGSILPRWARRDHPILARELEKLPHFPGSRRRSVLWPTLVFLTMGACVCVGSGGIPLHLVLFPLSWIPLAWAVPVVVREREQRTWDTLRVMPYGGREIVLAKFCAVLYRLALLWEVLLVGQTGSLLGGGFTAILFGRAGVETGRQRDLVLVMGVMLVFTLIMHTLEFLTNVLLGVFASLLPANRSMVYAGALGMRSVLTLFYLLFSLMLVFVFTGQFARPGELVFSALLAGIPGWVLVAINFQPGAALAIAFSLLATQAILFVGLLLITLRQADRG